MRDCNTELICEGAPGNRSVFFFSPGRAHLLTTSSPAVVTPAGLVRSRRREDGCGVCGRLAADASEHAMWAYSEASTASRDFLR
jgi:hypothetical protein